MNHIKEVSLAMSLGFLADQALDVLGDVLPPVAPGSKEVFRSLSEAIELLYSTDASELGLRNSDYLHLATGGLKDEVQRAAGRSYRMASHMAKDVAHTLEVLAVGTDVSNREIKEAQAFLMFLSQGALAYVDCLQEARVPHFP